jgi:molecular chaperone HtpG
MPECRVVEVDVSELTQQFEDLTLEEREQVFEFVRLADLVLQPMKCAVQMRKFAPENLPALYTSNRAATFLRSVEQSKEVADPLWSEVLDRIAADPAACSCAQLCLNFRNPMVRRLIQLTDRGLVRSCVEVLYVHSLLLGHHPLKAGEMALLNQGVLKLIELGIGAKEGGTA